MNPHLLLLNPVALNTYLMKRMGPLETWGTATTSFGGQIEAFHIVPGT